VNLTVELPLASALGMPDFIERLAPVA